MDEEELIVSQRDLKRIHVIRLTLERGVSVQRGAELLGLSARQIKRLRKKMRERGAQGLLHGNRGRRPWNGTAQARVKKVLGLAKGRYQGLNDTHLTEKLGEKEGLKLSRATVRRIVRQGGIAAARRHRLKRHYKRRERRAQEGALVLWDGSPHRWQSRTYSFQKPARHVVAGLRNAQIAVVTVVKLSLLLDSPSHSTNNSAHFFACSCLLELGAWRLA